MDFTFKTLLENAKDYNEKNMIRCLENVEKVKIDNIMVSQLYKSAVDKSYKKYDDIAESKGDIEKYKGYPSMIECISILKSLMNSQGIKCEEIYTLEKAISNIKAHKNTYTDGFALKKNLIIMQYNTMVLACIQATSCIIYSYIDYTRRVDNIEFTIVNNTTKPDTTLIDILNKYNMSCNSGENRKLLTLLMKDKEGFMGVDDLILGGTIIGLALSIVPIMRELIFYFYYTRMKSSEYIEHQCMLIELNKTYVANNIANPKKRREILKNQEKTVNKLMKLSEKIKVDHKLASNKASTEIKSENKKLTLDSLRNEAIKVDSNFTLL